MLDKTGRVLKSRLLRGKSSPSLDDQQVGGQVGHCKVQVGPVLKEGAQAMVQPQHRQLPWGSRPQGGCLQAGLRLPKVPTFSDAGRGRLTGLWGGLAWRLWDGPWDPVVAPYRHGHAGLAQEQLGERPRLSAEPGSSGLSSSRGGTRWLALGEGSGVVSSLVFEI